MELYVATSLEIAIHFAVLPLIGLNLYAIGATSVIHFNLKTLLQVQTLGILLASVIRPVMIVTLDWRTGRPNSLSHMGLQLFLCTLAMCVAGLVGHAITIERCYATIKVRKYEQEKCRCFVCACLTILVSQLSPPAASELTSCFISWRSR